MITPRTTRLIRAADLSAFRAALTALVFEGGPIDVRDRLVVVPTRAAGAFLMGAVEREHLTAGRTVVHPTFVTSRELPSRLAERAQPALLESRPEAREILMGVACRDAARSGQPPPFELRPGLVAEVLAFYDDLARRRKDIATFERLALGRLEPGADYDRGAERLVRQTRFLVSAFSAFERLCQEHAFVDEHALRRVSTAVVAALPWRHAVIAVGDDSRDRYGLCPADWDTLTRVAGLERLDLVVTEQSLAGAWHERVHDLLPGVEEVSFATEPREFASLRVPVERRGREARSRVSPRAWDARDREDETAEFARWVRELYRTDPSTPLDRIALVVRQPLPYVYVAREVLRSANVPSQTFDTLPLAAEPYAAAVDLVFSCVSTNMSRTSSVALLLSPHFAWLAAHEPVSAAHVAAADLVLSERGYLGGLESLQAVLGALSPTERPSSRLAAAVPALKAIVDAASELEPLRTEAPAANHLETLLSFLIRHDSGVTDDDPTRSRRLRARAAILGELAVLRDDYRALDSVPVGFDHVAALVRRWIEAHTFAPRSGEGGVQLVDAESARFGDFDHVQIAGLVDGEWPEHPRRNIFYGASLLRDLGWASESERVDHARAAFVDLLGLPAKTLTVSTFGLEDDSTVAPSALLDEVDSSTMACVQTAQNESRIFEVEVLRREPVVTRGLGDDTREAVDHRLGRPPQSDAQFHGLTAGHIASAHSLSGLERYQDCPFKFFAHNVLRLAEVPDDEPFLSPRARGRFIHEVFHRFFEAWDARGTQTITVENAHAARALFTDIAEPLLASLDESDSALERARLFGSAIAVGLIDVVVGLEASRPAVVRERWLESSFDGTFTLGQREGMRIPIRGVADRVDLLEGNRLRVIDYKTGYAPTASRALQVPVYALCAQEQAQERDGQSWTVAEAAYIAFTGRRTFVPIVEDGENPEPVLTAARERLLEVVDGITRGAFPPSPHDVMLCRTCAYATVCRKDYVDAQS